MLAEVARQTAELEQRLGAELARQIAESEQRLGAELARHAKAIQDAMSTQISAVDEKYRDLPSRVRRLEAKASARTRR